MSWLALSASFEYLYYGSTAVINIFTLSLTVRRSTLNVRIDPCAVRVIKGSLLVINMQGIDLVPTI